MEEITRCNAKLSDDRLCPLRDKCLRFKLPPPTDHLFVWYLDAPYDSATNECDHMIETKARSCSRQTR